MNSPKAYKLNYDLFNTELMKLSIDSISTFKSDNFQPPIEVKEKNINSISDLDLDRKLQVSIEKKQS